MGTDGHDTTGWVGGFGWCRQVWCPALPSASRGLIAICNRQPPRVWGGPMCTNAKGSQRPASQNDVSSLVLHITSFLFRRFVPVFGFLLTKAYKMTRTPFFLSRFLNLNPSHDNRVTSSSLLLRLPLGDLVERAHAQRAGHEAVYVRCGKGTRQLPIQCAS